jgi:hypothetical protein
MSASVCPAAQLQDEADHAGELGDKQEQRESAHRRGQDEYEVACLESMETQPYHAEAEMKKAAQ